MFSSVENVKIVGIAAAVSGNWVDLNQVSSEDEAIIKKFVKKTGVEGRYAASPYQTTSDFCLAAAERLIQEKGIVKEDIGILVFVTQSADYIIPATACLLQERLKLSRDCLAFDVNLGCSGYTYGLNIAGSLLSRTNTKYALLLAGDTSARERSTKRREKTSHSASMLFGDSGTATLIEKSNEGYTMNISSRTDGSGYKAIIKPYGAWRHYDIPEGQTGGTQMDDIEVFNFATEEAPEQINSFMRDTNTTPDDYDCLVLHQANMMILKRIAKKTGFSEDKNLISINKFGNTSSSSIPITLVDTYGDNNEDREIDALCCGFGIGLSWATANVKVNIKDILPLVHTDAYFVDGYVDG